MSAWDAYPDHYREKEVRAILAAVKAGECVSVIGLSGAGKSNLMGFLFHRCHTAYLNFALIDGNRSQPQTAQGLFHLTASVLSGKENVVLEDAVAERLSTGPGGLCLLFDRFDALAEEERKSAAGPLRALRDAYKYQLTYVTATRRPLDAASELAELFYANTIWLGPLSAADARWSASQYGQRHGQAWDEQTLEKLIAISGGYPSLLRACCEAAAQQSAGQPLEEQALRSHPAVQRRVQEFWADSPTPEDLRSARVSDLALLQAATPPVSADSPELTASGHRLRAYFQTHEGQVCEKDALIAAVWPEERVTCGLRDDSLAQLIRRLRLKIGAEHVHTIPGRGYRFMPSGTRKRAD